MDLKQNSFYWGRNLDQKNSNQFLFKEMSICFDFWAPIYENNLYLSN